MTFFNIFSNEKEEKNKPKVIVDNRERNSLVPSELVNIGFQIEFEQLPVADYLLNNIAIERKTISDLKSSIINKRIFAQMQELKQYTVNLLVIEGSQEELFNNEIINANAIKGFLLSASIDYKVPLIFSSDEEETAKYFLLLSKRNPDKEISIRAKKISLSKEQQIQYLLEGFPNIGPKKAKALMKKFHSLRNIVNASSEELEEILGSRTKEFLDLINSV